MGNIDYLITERKNYEDFKDLSKRLQLCSICITVLTLAGGVLQSVSA